MRIEYRVSRTQNRGSGSGILDRASGIGDKSGIGGMGDQGSNFLDLQFQVIKAMLVTVTGAFVNETRIIPSLEND